jgi:transposase InsO family protein
VRSESTRSKKDKDLLMKIIEIYQASKGRYGSPRVFNALRRQGIAVSKKRVARLMRTSGLVARCVRVCQQKIKLKRFQQSGKNLLLKLNQPTDVNQVWVGDITYLKVNGRWQYLATVMDLYSRRILSWSLSKDRKSTLTVGVLKSAIKKRAISDSLIFHSDRGIEYLAYEFRDELKKHGIKQSFNRAGHCTDNAFMESFYHSLKGELIRKMKYKTVKELRNALKGYINGFYNRVRLHSGLEYLSPLEYEQRQG